MSFCSIAEIKHNIVNQLSLNKIKKKNLGRVPEVSATGVLAGLIGNRDSSQLFPNLAVF